MNKIHPEPFDLRMSAEAQPLLDAVKRHITENVEPISEEFFAQILSIQSLVQAAPGPSV